MKKTKIILQNEPMGDGYQVCIADSPGHWGRGNTRSEALGDFLRTHAAELNIEIEDNSKYPKN